MSQSELEAYRLELAKIRSAIGKRMAETSTKPHIYDDSLIVQYIDDVLTNGWNLIETSLSDEPLLVDAQHLKRWATVIKDRAMISSFGTLQAYSLRLLRSNIVKSKTLHELRQAVGLMVGPLQLHREVVALTDQLKQDSQASLSEIAELASELEAANQLLAERKRVLDAVFEVYDEGDSDMVLLRNIESAKAQHGLSDTVAAAMFGCTRQKLRTMRETLG